jgi:hypothetical protein
MPSFGTEYHVARATGRCAATGRALEPGEACIATLCDLPGEPGEARGPGLQRRDFSLAAWESGARPEGLFSFWRTVVPKPSDRRRLLVDDAVLMDLFERLAGDERPQRVAFRFVLGLILLRKKLLRFAGRTGDGPAGAPGHVRGGEERWLMIPRGALPEDPPIAVINPHLSDDDVRDLTEQLSEVLQSEL